MSDNEQPKIPKGHYKSCFGGYERTKLAGYQPGATASPMQRISADERRARIRARKRAGVTNLEAELEATLALLDEEAEAEATRDFHNG